MYTYDYHDGRHADWGEYELHAAKMAIEDINASGMLGGNTLDMPPELVIDYHCWPEGAAEKARSLLKQNIIALTGDFITDGGDLPAVRELAQRLTDICDVYFVSGNHDFASGKIDELSDILKACGVKYLRNEYVVLERRGERIVLAGVEDPNSWADLEPPEEFIGRLRAEFPDDYVVLLGHRNYWMEKYPELPVQLILCGHSHGGIVRIPGIGGLLGTDRTLFPDYEAGKYDNGRYTMIVSRGIGNSVALPRFFNRPEIVGVVLKN